MDRFQDDIRPPATEQLPEHAAEVFANLVERGLETLLGLRIELDNQLLELPMRGGQVVTLPRQEGVPLLQFRKLVDRVEIDVPQTIHLAA